MTLQERDKKHLWHPLKQHGINPDSLAIVKAKGCILTDENGNEYIDAISSWYTCMYGHSNDFITSRVYKQMQSLDQVMFSDFTHAPAVELSEELIKILPENQNRIYFNDNGSTAVESAIKMALQYHFNNNDKRNVFIALENGFHGDTFGAMSVSGLSVYNGPFEDFLIEVERIAVPNSENITEVLARLQLLTSTHKIAGFIYEPLVQGAAGMKVHQPEYLEKVLAFCKENDVLLIADEVMTGFGKTGKNFASDYLPTKPDMICLSKALTGGLLPMAITSCTEKIYDAFLSNEIGHAFFHCHTYSANPVGCSAALASIELLQSDAIQHNIKRIITSHDTFKNKIISHPKVKNIQHLGVIFALELNTTAERYGGLREKLLKVFMDNGVFLRPLGNTIYIQPPYVISEQELQKVYDTIELALSVV